MVCRRPPERPSAGYRTVQSRVPRSGLVRRYVTLASAASSLNDASTAREEEAASTLTLPPKRRGRESTGGCQVLRFAACLTRPDGTSARTPGLRDPVESTHPRGSILPDGSDPSSPSARFRSAGAICSARPQPRPRVMSASSRATSRLESRSAMSRRRSWSCFPRARPTSIFARPRSFR